jgi:hypothetical protein
MEIEKSTWLHVHQLDVLGPFLQNIQLPFRRKVAPAGRVQN